MSGNGNSGPDQRPRGLTGVALRCQPDSRLVALVRGGYGDAFEEITRRYRPSLTSFAGSIVPAHRAEDVVQDALIKAYRSLPKSDPDLSLRPWLYTIVRNTALNDLRDERVHEHLDENWDGVPQPAEVAARRAELAVLFQRIKDLPPQQREALVKRELEGRSHEEIAVAIGATPGAVRALIFRARTALRDGVGLLIPLPLLRALMNGGSVDTASGGAGLGGAAATLTAGGGGAALKAGGAMVVGVLAIGSGIAIHDRGHSHRDPPVTVAEQRDHGDPRGPAASSGGADRSDATASSHRGPGSSGSGGGDPNRGPGGDRGSDSSSNGGSSGDGGPGPANTQGRGSAGGPGPGGGERSSGGDRSGSGGGGDGASGTGDGGDHSGSGGGGSETSGGGGGSGETSGPDGGTSGDGETTADDVRVGGDGGGGGGSGDDGATTSSGSGSGSGSGSHDASGDLTD